MADKGSSSIEASSGKKASLSKKVASSSSGVKKHRPPLSWPWASGIFLALLTLPTWAAVKLSGEIDWRFIATYFGLISGLTFVFYWSDKRKAQQDQWRIPEGTLHLLELLGGWPPALMAQRVFRHKTKKKRYQTIFWLIILLHQLLSFEVVSAWWLSRTIWQTFF